MTNEEISALVEKYFKQEDVPIPGDIEFRFDPDSSAILYSLIREMKPTSCLSIGTWQGGADYYMVSALKKNDKKFHYTASEIDDRLRDRTMNNVLHHTGVRIRMLGDITTELSNVPEKLDLLFVDTNHDETTTQWIVDNIFPRVATGGLVVFHDWAVKEVDGRLVGKGDGGVGGWPETALLMRLHEEHQWPFEKTYWTYGNPAWVGMSSTWETGFWIKA